MLVELNPYTVFFVTQFLKNNKYSLFESRELETLINKIFIGSDFHMY